MRKEDFMDCQNSTKMFRLNLIRHSKFAQRLFVKPNHHQVPFKLSDGDKELQFVNIGKKGQYSKQARKCDANSSVHIKFLNLVSNVWIKKLRLQEKADLASLIKVYAASS